jgi:hypothetical protein
VTLPWALFAAGASNLWAQTGGAANLTSDAPPNVRLTWQTSAPATCIEPEAIERDVEARLQTPTFQRGPAALELRASFEQVSERRVVRLELFGPGGTELGSRELASSRADCAELRVLLPTVIAVLLNPHLSTRTGGSAAVVAPGQPIARPAGGEPKKETTEVLADAGQSPPRARSVPSARAGVPQGRCALGPTVLAGVAPGLFSPAASLGCALSIGNKFDVDLDLSYRSRFSEGGTPGLKMTAAAGRSALCWSPGFSTHLRDGLCGGAAVARVQARSEGLDDPEQDARWIPELWLWGRLDWDFSTSGFARLGFGGALPLIRPIYVYETREGGDTRRLYQPAVLIGMAQISAGLRWQ